MAEVHHFAYGWFNPVVAFLMAFLGSLLGLGCTARARASTTRGRHARWLVLASFAIGGAAIWLMHFMAILGFDVPGSPVRYDLVLTIASLFIAVLTVGIGIFIAGQRKRSAPRILLGGVFTGAGVVAMHYTGMAAMHVAGIITYDPGLVGASVVIAVVAATTALWFTVSVNGWKPILPAALIMGVAVCGMHYTGMAAMHVYLRDDSNGYVAGISPLLLIVPITLLTSAALIGLTLNALQAMTEEEFAGVTHKTPPPSASDAYTFTPPPAVTDRRRRSRKAPEPDGSLPRSLTPRVARLHGGGLHAEPVWWARDTTPPPATITYPPPYRPAPPVQPAPVTPGGPAPESSLWFNRGFAENILDRKGEGAG
jgi:NO-binding membrane sensor protein with MHYT domain